MDKDREVVYKLKCISIVSFAFMTVEIMGGIMAGSIAILADAFHLLSDVLAYVISLQAVLLSRKVPPFFMTFGYEKIQPLGALINVSIIWFVTIELVIEATQRIINKSIVKDPLYMLLTSFFGLGCNLYIMRVLHSDEEHGGHQGCSHSHGHGHGHNHNHEHNEHHDHDHGHSHKHGSSCKHQHSAHKQKSDSAKKCNHNHSDSNHGHHDHDHHDHDDDDHDHHSHDDHNHKHSSTCSHSHQKKLSSSEQNNLESLTLNKGQFEQNLSDESLRIAKKEQARRQLFNNINIQAAYIHIISDIILSIGVIISAIIIYIFADREVWTYWQLADPFCTYFFSIMAIYSTVSIAKDSVLILLDGCDDKTVLNDIIAELDSISDIQRYEDLRVWSLNRSKFVALVKIYLSKSNHQDLHARDRIQDRVATIFSGRNITHYVEIVDQELRQLKEQ